MAEVAAAAKAAIPTVKLTIPNHHTLTQHHQRLMFIRIVRLRHQLFTQMSTIIVRQAELISHYMHTTKLHTTTMPSDTILRST